MKYFTKDLIERYGSPDDAVANAADAEWEATLERYERHLHSIELELPPHVREFTELLLHAALVTSIARQGDKLIMVLRKDVPPRDLVTLTYTLTGGLVIDKEAISGEHRSEVMDYRYDEFDLVREGNGQTYIQSILFGNGWELSLRFSDVQVSQAEPVYPPPGTIFVPASSPAIVPSA